MIPAANCRRCQRRRWQIATGINDTGGNHKGTGKFATGVVDTGGKFAADVVDTGGNLPLVSRTLVATAQGELVAKFATGSLIPVANLPPMSLIPAAI
jgi:hypothetical protein